MNLLPGRLVPGGVQTDLGVVALPNGAHVEANATAVRSDGSVVLGVRPEHLHDAAMVSVRSTGAQEVVAVVDVLESLARTTTPTRRPRRRDRGGGCRRSRRSAAATGPRPCSTPTRSPYSTRRPASICRGERRLNPDLLSQHLQRELGAVPQRASVTFLGAEPIDVLRFADVDAGCLTYVTAGASRHPMADPADQPRSGPGPARRGGHAADTAREAGLRNLHKALAMIAAAPMVEGLVLGPDALVDLGAPLWTAHRSPRCCWRRTSWHRSNYLPRRGDPLPARYRSPRTRRHGFASKVPRRCARRGRGRNRPADPARGGDLR